MNVINCIDEIKKLFPIEKLHCDLFEYLKNDSTITKDKNNNYLIEAYDMDDPEKSYFYAINETTPITFFEIRIDDEIEQNCTRIRIMLALGAFTFFDHGLHSIEKCLAMLYYRPDLFCVKCEFGFLSVYGMKNTVKTIEKNN